MMYGQLQAAALYRYAHVCVTKQVGGAGITNIYRVTPLLK